MKNNASSLKRLSLIIAVVGLLSLIAGLALFNQANLKETAELLQVAGGIILGIGALGLVVAWREGLIGFSRTRQARYGANAVLLSLSFIGVVVLLNYLMYRHDTKIDLTANKSFTLSEQTDKVLANLPQDVKITAFYRANNNARQEALNRLETYRDKANGKLSFEMVDPERQPGLTLRYNVTSDGTVVLESGSARKEILSSSEEQLTSGILAITRTEKPTVYFLTGHNELDPDNADPRTGLNSIKQSLEQENYRVAKLSLAATGNKVPDDARVLVVAGPDRALTAPERTAIQEYIDKRQGDVMLLLPPRNQSGLEGLLGRYGVQIGNNIVIDPGRNIQNDITVPAFTEYGFHPITQDLNQVVVFLPLSRTVGLNTPPANVQGVELMKTTAASWAETNLTENALIQKDSADPAGPLSMAVALTVSPEGTPPKEGEQPKQSRIVVVGNAMFAANWFSRVLGNGDFFLNSIAWLSEADDLISIRAKAPEDRSLQLTNSQERLVFYVSIFGMPGLLLLLGVWIWWRRR